MKVSIREMTTEGSLAAMFLTNSTPRIHVEVHYPQSVRGKDHPDNGRDATSPIVGGQLSSVPGDAELAVSYKARGFDSSAVNSIIDGFFKEPERKEADKPVRSIETIKPPGTVWKPTGKTLGDYDK